MKKLVCGCCGKIYYAQILENGKMLNSDRVEVTDDALKAVVEHITSMANYNEKGYAGYSYTKIQDNAPINLLVYDVDKYLLVPRDKIIP